jgi:hypothetical protein
MIHDMGITLWLQIVFMLELVFIRKPLEARIVALEARLLEIDERLTAKMSALEARQLKLESWQTEIKEELSWRPITMTDAARRKQLRWDI